MSNDTWTQMERERRQTGRTWRMVQEARRLDNEGHKVYIIVPTVAYGKSLRQVYGLNSRIGLESFDTLSNFDPITGRLLGAHPNCRVLIDHSAIEMRYSYLLTQLHRFDGQLPEGIS
jgi:hypothetical protein